MPIVNGYPARIRWTSCFMISSRIRWISSSRDVLSETRVESIAESAGYLPLMNSWSVDATFCTLYNSPMTARLRLIPPGTTTAMMASRGRL